MIEPIPFLDLDRLHADLGEALDLAWKTVLGHGRFVNGPEVAAFEAAFADYCDVTGCVGVGNGTDALELILAGLGIGAGDEVIVPTNTFVATVEAVVLAGATPRLVDVDPRTLVLRASDVDDAITARTAAVIAVDLHGNLPDMNELTRVADDRGIALVEDAAQAHGASWQGRPAGSFGVASCFSFYPGKNLGALGDAGAVTTNDEQMASRVRALREHGQSRKYHHDEIGWTARLDTLQAAILSRKLTCLDEWNDERRTIAALYLDGLSGIGDLRLPNVPDGSRPVWHLFVVRTADPVGLAEHLARLGIASGRHYPQPPHLSRAYASLGFGEGAFPVAEAIGRECLSLPIFPGMTESEVVRVADSVRSWFDRG